MDTPSWLPYEKRYHYPGMAPLDRNIWERFVAANPDAFDECWYNVAIGEGTPMDTIVSPDTGGDVNRLYQRKIDVLARRGDAFYVIEIGPRASTAKIGQVRGYARILARDWGKGRKLYMMLLTDAELPEMRLLAEEEGVELQIV